MSSERSSSDRIFTEVRAARDSSAFPGDRITSLEDALEQLRDARKEIAELREQLDQAVRRVAVRCAGPRCEGRGVYYPTDGEKACLEDTGRQT